MGDQYGWLGGSGKFADAGQWQDFTQNQDPADQPPGSGDGVLFSSDAGGGTISGPGDVLAMSINGVDITFTGNITVSEGISADDGSIVNLGSGASVVLGNSPLSVFFGSSVTIASATVTGGDVLVDNAGSNLEVASGGNISLTVGGAGVILNDGATFEVESGGTVSGTIGQINGGASATVTGGEWSSSNGMSLGVLGAGTLAVSGGGTVTSGSGGALSLGLMKGAAGTVTVSGDGSALVGNYTTSVIGGQGGGDLAISAGGAAKFAGTLDIGVLSGANGTVEANDAAALLSVGAALIVGDAGAGTVTIGSGATMTTSDAVVIGQDGSGDGTLTLDGNATSFTDGGDLTVGASGDGTVSVQGGATLDVSSGAVLIGATADSSGLITLAGTGMPLTLGKDLTVGQAGDGTLDVQAGVTLDVNSGTVAVGVAMGGAGTITLAGTGTVFSAGQDMTVGGAGGGSIDIGEGVTAAVTGSLAVGASMGGTGTISLSGSHAALSAGANVTVGDAGTGVVTIADGGSLDAGSGTFTIGSADGSTGTLAVSGSSAAVSLGSLVVGDTGKGTLTIDSGSQLTTSDDVVVGSSSGGAGTVTVTGANSLLDAGGTLTVGDAGSGEIDINQGSVEVFSGAVTLGQSAGGSGSISLRNASLDLSGSLLIGKAGSGSIEVAAKGRLQAQDITLGAVTNGSGNLLVDGSGASAQSSDLTIGVDGQGGIEVSARGSLDTSGQAILGVGALPVVQQQAAILGQASWSVGSVLDVGAAGNATMTIGSGGKVSAGSVVLGDLASATGTVTVGGTIGTSGGGTAAASLFFASALTVGNAGMGSLVVNQGGVVGSKAAKAGTIDIAAVSGATGTVSVSDAGSSMNAAVLAVGGSNSAAGGSAILSIGTGAVVNVSTVTVWGGGTITLAGGALKAGSILKTAPITVDGEVAGFGTVGGGIVDNGIIAAEDGRLTLSGSVSGGGTLAFGGVATLVLAKPGAGIAAPVAGLGAGDRIELAGLTITRAQVTSPGTVTVTTTGTNYVLSDVSFVAGAPQIFVTGHDATSGDDFIRVACFAAGTRIAGARGEVAVEHLRVGDLVATARIGRARPIVWIGYRDVDCTRHPDPTQVWPVCVLPGAFGPGRPKRAVFLSPDHAVFVGGVLIPVKYLIDHDAIRQLPVRFVTYFHLELPEHDVVLADGLPVETYLGGEDRADFANGGGAMRLHPDFAIRQREAFGCAPLVVTGAKLAAARRLVASGDLEHPVHLHGGVGR